MRRFRQFRDLHMSLVTTYGPLITSLPFPSRRLFGNKSDQVSGNCCIISKYFHIIRLNQIVAD